jgi:hypothetical protein
MNHGEEESTQGWAQEIRPTNERSLRRWVENFAGIDIPEVPVCHGHTAPWSFFADFHLRRPSVALVLGPRGGGKSFLSALDTHIVSRFETGHATRFLGGSLAQSQQAYLAINELARSDPALKLVTERSARYRNGSEIRMLAASATSVRGPHVPSLKLDEVDEIEPEIRDAALGMCMNRKGAGAAVLMTSTWHRVGGPMADLMERALAGEFPLYRFCVFEVLERCPTERSGAELEKCPECPIFKWCHEDRELDPNRLPKAKRSNGHYGIEALIQKVKLVGRSVFESDYLCRGPKADGLWFSGFDSLTHVTASAEYDPAWPVHLSVDTGVYTGAVLFQIVERPSSSGPIEEVHVFADFLAQEVPAETAARQLLDVVRKHCNGRIDTASTDPAGAAKTAVGPTVLAEYRRGGLQEMRHWPRGSVADGLALIESFVRPADGGAHLLIHPRCVDLVQAFQSYRRAKRGKTWTDQPEDPQHPSEDLMDALRGGLRTRYPEGRIAARALRRVSASRVF